ncbi:MAG: cobalamin B12-binding domain-containing protein [Desulfobacterales bacterium]|nr:cobalamin B12-binding domain-containing protein [Desulfobacterales bacterium]
MESERKIKVLITKVGLDGHDRGAKVVSSLLKEAGMEVVYLGMFQTPENVVRAAIEEDVDVIGLSCLSGEHITFTPRIMKLLKEKRIDGVLFIIGGVIPLEDIPVLKDMGVNEVFTAGTLTGPTKGTNFSSLLAYRLQANSLFFVPMCLCHFVPE